ncbi:Qat anti-phage system TatD family nuclease QatD [Olivibacter jilunii]|uniref:Qat anti-phage system TatD family nuclease QatD n=1 Tax=Olivibacter jilunii TaxID=985016 RepID=UPI001031095F|nr:Qat anti-phage system TatD family nuclease QatD [Olivibacter jilunii]
MLFDTHFHLDLVEDNFSLVQRLEKMKIYTIAVTNLPKLFDHTEKLCKGLKYIRPALGYHPELASRYKNQLPLFRNLIGRTRYIGEVGLDNLSKTPQDFNDQKEVFSSIMNLCAEDGNKILTIHSRRAEKQVISMIGNNFPGKIVLHWYSGSLKDLEMALFYGFYFSINYSMTQSVNGAKIIEALPFERILLETDGPFTMLDNVPFTPLKVEIIINEIIRIKKNKAPAPKIDAWTFYNNFKTFLSN